MSVKMRQLVEKDYMISKPYIDGYKSGYTDRRLGVRNSYSAFIESTPGYARDYARGYNAGNCERLVARYS